MRSIPESLQSHLKSGATTLCNCWKVTRKDGAIFGFTDHDNPLTFDGITFEADTGFIGSESLSRIGLSVDNTEIHSALSSGTLEEKDLANGLYDNAAVEQYLVNWQAPEEHLILRKGNIGEVRRGTVSFMAEVRGLAHNLQQPQGRLFQSTCDAVVGDMRCKINLETSTYSATATITDIDEDQTITTENLQTYASNWFKGGIIEWQTGTNAGAISEVKTHQRVNDDNCTLSIWQRLAESPVSGDQFKIFAGCDKRFSTCKTKFNNQINFRGFPHIPGNDFLISSPNQNDGTQDGSSQN